MYSSALIAMTTTATAPACSRTFFSRCFGVCSICAASCPCLVNIILDPFDLSDRCHLLALPSQHASESVGSVGSVRSLPPLFLIGSMCQCALGPVWSVCDPFDLLDPRQPPLVLVRSTLRCFHSSPRALLDMHWRWVIFTVHVNAVTV